MEEDMKASSPPKTGGENAASSWERKSKQEEAKSADEKFEEAESAMKPEEAESSSNNPKEKMEASKTWGDMLPTLAWRRRSEPEAAAVEEVQKPNPETVAQQVISEEKGKVQAENEKAEKSESAKTWGEIIPPALKPSHWRRKSRDEGETSVASPDRVAVEEVQKPNTETLPNHELSEKVESKEPDKTATHVPAKTWGEMIHPALHWRRKSRDEGEPSEANVGTDGANVKESIDDALKETSDDVPYAAEGTLSAVAASIRRSIAGMSRWSMADLTLGLYKLSGRHKLEGAADTIDGSPVSSLDELQEVLHWFHWAFAAYKKDKQKLLKELEIEESQVLKHVVTSAILKPAYFIAVDNVRRCVVLSIRGTLAATDVLTDLNPHSEEFEGGSGHSGMLAAARWLMDNETNTLREVLTANPEYRLVLVGHSLGAGTAALLCMLLREYDSKRAGPLSRLGVPPSWITCWGYGCPPCVDKRLAEEAGFIKNVVLQDDVVARVTPAALEVLRTEILDTDWSQAFEDGSKGKKMLELVQSTYAALPGSHIAKKYGHAALAAARTGAFAGTQIHKAANWFAVGMAAAEFLRSATSHTQGTYGSVPGEEEGAEVAAATVVANAAEAAKDTSEALEMQRLYVPGVLYHILRKPLRSEAIQLASDFGGDKASTGKEPQFEHIVVRGDDPSSRFSRIVLSGTLLSDHGCLQYNEALVDAIRWASHR